MPDVTGPPPRPRWTGPRAGRALFVQGLHGLPNGVVVESCYQVAGQHLIGWGYRGKPGFAVPVL
eukprot:5624341-Pyramimonas_sp.AAC.1